MLRLDGRFYELSQEELRTVLGLPASDPGLGISIDGDRLSFEFAADEEIVKMSARQLQRRLAKRPASVGCRAPHTAGTSRPTYEFGLKAGFGPVPSPGSAASGSRSSTSMLSSPRLELVR